MRNSSLTTTITRIFFTLHFPQRILEQTVAESPLRLPPVSAGRGADARCARRFGETAAGAPPAGATRRAQRRTGRRGFALSSVSGNISAVEGVVHYVVSTKTVGRLSYGLRDGPRCAVLCIPPPQLVAPQLVGKSTI